MTTSLIPSLRLLAALAALLCSAALSSQTLSTEQFYGRFEGSALSSETDEVSKRDITVEIGPPKRGSRGFELTWTTVTKRASGKVKRKEYTVNFVPSTTDNVFASAMRTNVFGKAIPLDPLKGDPYVWATLDGATLTVHALIVTEDFGYEIQTYARTRTATGMDLRFSRIRNGRALKEISGSLVKVD